MQVRLSTRLILGVLLIEAVMLGLLVWNSVRLISDSHAELLENSTSEETRIIANSLAPGLLANDLAVINDSLSLLKDHRTLVHLDVHDRSGNVVASLHKNTPHTPHTLSITHSDLLKGVKSSVAKHDETFEDATNDGIFDVIQKVELYGQHLGTLHAGYSIKPVLNLTNTTRFQNTSIAVIGIILSLIATILLGLFLTRGLRKLEEGAQIIGSGKLQHRIEIDSNDEISDVAQSFNQMASHLSKGKTELEQQNKTLTEQTGLLAEQSKHIRLLMDSTAEAIYGADLKGICTFVNPACLEMLGYQNQDELVGQSIHEMIHHTLPDGSAYPKTECKVGLATLSGKAGHSDNEVHWRKDGSSFPIEWWSHPITEDGKITGSVVTFIDITERRQAEQDLQEANDKLEERVKERTKEYEKASNAKSEFLSRMSHELRTPLNAILGFGQILKLKAERDGTETDSLNEILQAGDHLLELINEVLDLSKIEAGKLDLSFDNVSIHELIEECQSLLNPLMEDRNLSFVHEYDRKTNYFIKADKIRTKQILLNLLSNAIKYNKPNGKVILEFHATDNNKIRISVTDTGPGIAEEKQGHLFKPFERLNASEGIEGTGIGLVLTKSLVELMEGEIGVISEPDKGSTFWFELNRTEDSRLTTTENETGTQPDSTRTIPEEKFYTVLCIEDNSANLKLMKQLLAERSDIELLTAHTGELGFNLATAHKPNLILLDIGLPGISGFEVKQRLSNSETAKDIPVIAISANAMPTDIEKARQVGFKGYLTKPININEFSRMVENYLPTVNTITSDNKDDFLFH